MADFTATPVELAEIFGLPTIDTRSLTPWAPVYRARLCDGTEVVVKRTAAGRERAEAMSQWTSRLRESGVSVVAPIPLEFSNPQPLGEDWWVVYPWIDGQPYRATPTQLASAGDLLGRMHSAPVPSADLRGYSWTDSDEAQLEDELATLRSRLAEVGGDESAAELVDELGRRWWARSLPAVRAAVEAGELLSVGVSSDYKAANLIYTTNGPVLVDPDNGGREPRLFDLALALTLFHNECPTAPGRMLTPAEWEQFVTPYLAHVDLTEVERRLWPEALDHMLWEEGTWVLEDNDAEAWADTRQRGFLLDLARTRAGRYPLPPA